MNTKLLFQVFTVLFACAVQGGFAQSTYDLRSVSVNSTTQSWVPDIQNYEGSQWHDMAGLVFASNDSNFDNLNGGILFLKGIVAIPEPGTYGLALVGMLLVLGCRHRIRFIQ